MRNDIDLDNTPHDLEGIRTYVMNLQRDFDAHNHDGSNSKSFLTLLAETVAARVMLIRKTSFTDTTNGFWMGLVGDTMKLIFGNSVNYVSWDGSTLTITGTISGSVITGGSLNINNNFVVDSNGFATAIGISSLNKKAYTNFESSGRFISTLIGTGSNTFGNQGVTIAPGATGTSSARLLWDIANVFTNNPTFTATLNMLSVGSGDARGFVGMGLPTIDGSGITYSGNSQIGFKVDKNSGVLQVSSEMNDGGSGTSVGTSITTLVDGDILELFIKVAATSVKWYYRKNGGTLTLGDTQTTHIPVSAGSQYLTFAMSNAGSANNCQMIMQCAAYEH